MLAPLQDFFLAFEIYRTNRRSRGRGWRALNLTYCEQFKFFSSEGVADDATFNFIGRVLGKVLDTVLRQAWYALVTQYQAHESLHLVICWEIDLASLLPNKLTTEKTIASMDKLRICRVNRANVCSPQVVHDVFWAGLVGNAPKLERARLQAWLRLNARVVEDEVAVSCGHQHASVLVWLIFLVIFRACAWQVCDETNGRQTVNWLILSHFCFFIFWFFEWLTDVETCLYSDQIRRLSIMEL